MKNGLVFSAFALLSMVGGATLAQHAHTSRQAASATQSAASELADGEVRRVDTDKGAILLKHGEIKSIGMGAMTMNFKLKDPSLAVGLKAGDIVKFAVEPQGDQLIVTRIKKVK